MLRQCTRSNGETAKTLLWVVLVAQLVMLSVVFALSPFVSDPWQVGGSAVDFCRLAGFLGVGLLLIGAALFAMLRWLLASWAARRAPRARITPA
jgi:hypothetical protein